MRKQPHVLELDKGTLNICACGRSAKLPFCDGTHQGTETTPYFISIDNRQKVAICGCFQSQNLPYCDGTHKTLK
ncbi:MAG: CDGSH iron-sulfur domain-containing protein [Deltaproteobacteria bacterium]|nr:CDGSH iron-sulfur domain-containing protein [Deltaproteobacteria bacterium]